MPSLTYFNAFNANLKHVEHVDNGLRVQQHHGCSFSLFLNSE